MISVTRPRNYADVLSRHLPLALVTGLGLVLAQTAPSGLFSGIPCLFHDLTGWPCPLCGLSRTFRSMAAGDWHFAFYNSPLGVVLYILTGIVFAWNLTGLLVGVTIGPPTKARRFLHSTRFFVLTAALVTANWLYRIILGM